MNEYVDTQEIKDRVAGQEDGVLASLGVDWRSGRPHINCPYPAHNDRHPSWRWDERERRAFCTCIPGEADDIWRIIQKVQGCDFVGAKLFAARAISPWSIRKKGEQSGDRVSPPPPPPPLLEPSVAPEPPPPTTRISIAADAEGATNALLARNV